MYLNYILYSSMRFIALALSVAGLQEIVDDNARSNTASREEDYVMKLRCSVESILNEQ